MNDKIITKYVRDWFARGDDDIRAAEILLKEQGAPNTICFHAQQAAEKYLKGFIAYHEKHVRKIHDLSALVSICIDIDKRFELLKEDAQFLSQFYTESRYPDDYIEFQREDAEEAFGAAQRIKEFVLEKIK
jgi:HEPN domain-containing protein